MKENGTDKLFIATLRDDGEIHDILRVIILKSLIVVTIISCLLFSSRRRQNGRIPESQCRFFVNLSGLRRGVGNQFSKFPGKLSIGFFGGSKIFLLATAG